MGTRYLQDDRGDFHSFVKANSGPMREALAIVDRLFDGNAHINVPIDNRDNYCIKKVGPVGCGVVVEVSLIVGEWHVQFTVTGAIEPYYSDFAPFLHDAKWAEILRFAGEKLAQSLTESDLFVPREVD